MQFREDLPSGCPPGNANQQGFAEAFRLVDNDPPGQADFDSHEALKKPRNPRVCPCRWSSCSMYTKRRLALKLLPRLRKKFIAKLEIPNGAGYARVKNGHIDFWMFKSFNPLDAVQEVESAPNG